MKKLKVEEAYRLMNAEDVARKDQILNVWKEKYRPYAKFNQYWLTANGELYISCHHGGQEDSPLEAIRIKKIRGVEEMKEYDSN